MWELKHLVKYDGLNFSVRSSEMMTMKERTKIRVAFEIQKCSILQDSFAAFASAKVPCISSTWNFRRSELEPYVIGEVMEFHLTLLGRRAGPHPKVISLFSRNGTVSGRAASTASFSQRGKYEQRLHPRESASVHCTILFPYYIKRTVVQRSKCRGQLFGDFMFRLII